METTDNDGVFHVPITDELDLHTFQPSEIKSVVEEYLYACQKEGITRVKVVHGKGKSVQKNIVRTLLQKHELVLEYHDAPPGSGGWGATIVYLKDMKTQG